MSGADRRTDVCDALLLATLPHVAFEGWSDRAIRAGIADCGLDAAAGRLAFPGGVRDLIEHWSVWSDRRMLDALQAAECSGLSLWGRAKLAIRFRLESNILYREAVRRTLAFLALPTHATLGLRLGWRTADAICYAAGDTATDVSFYTHRAALAGTYAATLLYWLDDDSDAFAETWFFLDRRMDETPRLPRPAAVLARLRQSLPPSSGLFRRTSW